MVEMGVYIYNTEIRQQMSSLESMDFSKLSQALFTTTLLVHRGKVAMWSKL